MKYLVIDDDTIFADALARALMRKGQEALVANNRQQALQIQQEQMPERIILDLKIGDDSGLQLLPELKAINQSTDIVLLTGYSSIPTAVEAIKQGAIQYLCKPVEIEEVLAAFEGLQEDSAAKIEVPIEPPSVDRLEWEHIQSVLMQNDGNVSATARALGMHRRTLQRKLQKRPAKK